MPRTLSELRFASFASAVISVYIIFAIMGVCLGDKEVTGDLNTAFKDAFGNFNISMFGIFRSLPLIIFAYMYQTNIPMIYNELADKSLVTIRKVLIIGTVGATVCYLIAGIFGYVTFINNKVFLDEIMEKQNILEVEQYQGNVAIYICRFTMLFVVLFATPLSILPCKDTCEELIWGGDHRMTKK